MIANLPKKVYFVLNPEGKVFLALSLSLFSGYGFLWFWIRIVVVHATVYRLLSK